MYDDHPNCLVPTNENVKIWRFIDFPKFVSMLMNNSLYFSGIESMEDPFEGTYSDYTIEKTKKDFQNRGINLNILKNNFIEMPKLFSSITYLNCWYMNEYEPNSMWKSYTSNNQGIAIQSTYAKLKDSFVNTKNLVNISQVKYIDYKKTEIPWGNMLDTLIHKRINYSDERELRAIAVVPPVKSERNNFSEKPHGHHIQVDLDILIDSVTMAPSSPFWIKELVCALLEKFSLKKQVYKSNLDDSPRVV